MTNRLQSKIAGSIWTLPTASQAVAAGSGVTKRVLVPAVDEARALLGDDGAREYDRQSFFRVWRHALDLANEGIARRFHRNNANGILPVFVDPPKSDIVNFAPPMYLWHNNWVPEHYEPLATHLLHQFHKLLLHDSVDGGVNEVVAWFVLLLLLLAMGACQSAVSGDGGGSGYAGEMYPLTTFLHVLQGSAVTSFRRLQVMRRTQTKAADHPGESAARGRKDGRNRSKVRISGRTRACSWTRTLSTDSQQQRGAALPVLVLKLNVEAEQEEQEQPVPAILVRVAHDFVPDEESDEELVFDLSRALVWMDFSCNNAAAAKRSRQFYASCACCCSRRLCKAWT